MFKSFLATVIALGVCTTVYAEQTLSIIKPDAVAWWFKTPHSILNDLRPLDLLRSPSGFKKVKDLLFSMRWGLPA